jgi:hypothetical protein
MKRRDFLWTCGTRAGATALSACRALHGGRVKPAELHAAAVHTTRRLAPTRFGQIAYVERGSGLATLFLHGFPLNGFQWCGSFERLSRHRLYIAPDFIGLGYDF